MSRRVTLRQIAREAGTTAATVSMALRGRPGVSAATAQRVREAAERLGYRGDPRLSMLMRYLRTGKGAPFKAVLAYIHDFPARDGHLHPHTHRGFFEGARERAGEQGYKLEVIWAREPGLTMQRLCGLLRARGIPGAILTTPLASRWPLGDEMPGVALAVAGYPHWSPLYSRACCNHHQSMLLLLRNLERLGYRRPGLVLTLDDDENTSHIWLSAYLGHEYFMGRSRRVAPLIGPAARIFSRSALGQWMKKQRPDCIVGHTVPLWNRLASAGVRVPEDVGFASLDVFPAPDYPDCSGIDQGSHRVGAAAVDLVTRQLMTGKLEGADSRLVLVEGAWHEGATTRAQPVEIRPI